MRDPVRQRGETEDRREDSLCSIIIDSSYTTLPMAALSSFFFVFFVAVLIKTLSSASQNEELQKVNDTEQTITDA